ncbi:MAG: hypothetical protein DMENIID0003_03780 [Wolbachia endosymbiont of Sergentomyia squamirostris]|uniref:Uncharacterized protein n=1 Tax=Wolbachia endosymbiont of Sergentomyia squamirostris TaxID=3113640 RepID=A0AAT9GC62_9RICK
MSIVSNRKESQAKKGKETSFYCKFRNFHVRGSSHVINTNSKHVKAQINSQRRIKAREKSVELKLPVKTFDDETRLTASELLQVLKNKEVRWFKNGTSVPEEHSTYLSGKFNPHKAKKIYANQAQKEAAEYFMELMTDKFYSFKRSKITDLAPIRENVIRKVFEKFQDHPEIKAIMVYIRNLWVTYDKHLYSLEGMKEQVDHHIGLIIKNTSQEKIEKLLVSGATPHEVYCTLRKIQGANLYRIGILATRGGYLLKVYIEKRLCKLLKYHFNSFKNKMSNMGITTRKDFFLITRRHLPFLFNKRYKSLYRRGLLCHIRNIHYVIFDAKICYSSQYDMSDSLLIIIF